MTSPIPKHLRSETEEATIRPDLRNHTDDLRVHHGDGVKAEGAGTHRAKYAPGLATALLKLVQTTSIGDPMAGTGTLAREAPFLVALNDIDPSMRRFLDPLAAAGHEVSIAPATEVPWSREVCIFSPPYYPRTDRRRPAAHNDSKRGAVVGFRDAYACDDARLIGNPGGVDAILSYRSAMREVYSYLRGRCGMMIVVTKNWTRLGVELRLDLDTILTAREAGWVAVARHGWRPPASLWARYNQARGGGVVHEDVLVFQR